ncbi:MAG: hypothetical protein PHF18_14460 [Methanosarcina sp.]|nr:hypothetical protein [Methanosarcina sp.]MDD3248031.1 hypothetical protein [Methanosarcina sp.]
MFWPAPFMKICELNRFKMSMDKSKQTLEKTIFLSKELLKSKPENRI